MSETTPGSGSTRFRTTEYFKNPYFNTGLSTQFVPRRGFVPSLRNVVRKDRKFIQEEYMGAVGALNVAYVKHTALEEAPVDYVRGRLLEEADRIRPLHLDLDNEVPASPTAQDFAVAMRIIDSQELDPLKVDKEQIQSIRTALEQEQIKVRESYTAPMVSSNAVAVSEQRHTRWQDFRAAAEFSVSNLLSATAVTSGTICSLVKQPVVGSAEIGAAALLFIPTVVKYIKRRSNERVQQQ